MKAERHPFAGCDKTVGHYQTIGRELLRFEHNKRFHRFGISRLMSDFRVGVSYVPVEVLESYLDDLLDIYAGEESLFIERTRRARFLQLTLIGMCIGIFALISFFAWQGSGYFQLAMLPSGVAVAFMIAWSLSPYSGIARRLGFARVLSQEISRRRGGHDGEHVWSSTRFALRGIFQGKHPDPAKGAALEILH